ncbi:hypothetical protein HanIR_Chr04g0167111 [Helianthus annuus]|nr:hypothetical protein HanIR_Chr04g0167111 [Helianthus annuus]
MMYSGEVLNSGKLKLYRTSLRIILSVLLRCQTSEIRPDLQNSKAHDQYFNKNQISYGSGHTTMKGMIGWPNLLCFWLHLDFSDNIY